MTTTAGADTRHFSYETAAEEFDIPERWLRTHIKTLPHRRFGRYVRFSVADLLEISDRYMAQITNEPVAMEQTPASATNLPDIRPSSQRRTTKQQSPHLREQVRAPEPANPPRSANSEKGS